MFNRMYSATSTFARRKASQSAAWVVFARDTVSGFITTAHHMLMVLGIAAIGAVGLMFVKPDMADKLKALSPFAAAHQPVAQLEEPAAPAAPRATLKLASDTAMAQPVVLLNEPVALEETPKSVSDARQQQWVTNWLSKRYRVASDAIDVLVSAAYATSREIKLDPLLILSVMAIESRFNPFAESPVGAQGLMQVMSKVHRDKFEDHGGVKAALDPVANIRVGSQILKEYVKRGGSVEAGLKLYVGAGAMETDTGYGAKVLAEYERLKEVAKGKKVSIYSTSVTPAPAKPKAQEAKADTRNEAESAQREARNTKEEQLAAL